MNSDTLSPTLPVEIFQVIVDVSPRDALPSLIRANSIAYAVGCRALYHTIGDEDWPLTAKQYIMLLKTLDTTESRPPYLSHPGIFVVKLFLRFDSTYCVTRVSANLLRLIRRVLHSLPHIKALGLDLSHHDSSHPPTWVFESLDVPLDLFSTSLRCDAPLARFLESQPSIHTLFLRPSELHTSFVLSPGALPGLETVWCDVLLLNRSQKLDLFRILISDRPVKSVSMQLWYDRRQVLSPTIYFQPLDAVTLGACPVRSLSFTAPHARLGLIIQAVSIRLPDLQKLEIQSREYTLENALEAVVHLEGMHKLETLSMIVANPILTLDSKRRIVEACLKSCPSLRSVQLS